MRLSIRNFAQIESADIDFGAPGDLTILVGQQATGKSLVLQWLKLCTDALTIRRDWERYGTNWKVRGDPLRPLDQFFGEGIGSGWSERTEIALDGKTVDIESLFNRRRTGLSAVESTYYIPAHRALLLSDGWPKNFQQHGISTPYVAKAQSERLARWLGDTGNAVFPIANRLQKELRDLFDAAIFHGAKLEIDLSSPLTRLVLRPKGEIQPAIPYMSWTAGQREFVPLLIALYELLPGGNSPRLQRAGECDIRTVVLEEPELGLHPKALFAVGVAMLHLMARGYRVVVSSHSPLMVDFAWAINRFRIAHAHGRADVRHLLTGFEMKSTAVTKDLAAQLFDRTARTYYLSYGKGGDRVMAKDISELRSYSSDPAQSSWGELLKYSTHLAEVIGNLDFDFSGAESASS